VARLSKLNRIFNSIELNYSNLTDQLNNWISSIYKKSSILYNSTSPYGQILTVVKEFFVQNLLYVKNTVRQLDIDQSVSTRTIRNIARISGHNPSRAISAKGTLKFKLKQGIDISKQVSEGKVVIYDETQIKNKSNNLYYSIKTGTYRNYYTLTSGCQFFVNLVQGKYETQTFTGDGTLSQSYQVTVSNNTTIDNFDFQISLNGIVLQIRDHIYDMLEDEYACCTRTGFNGGLDIYFGNGIHGCIPNLGSTIEVKYLTTNGLYGNILNNKNNDFTFINDIYDSYGNVLQADTLFDVFIETDVKFASDGESVEYTKSVIPYVSRNFVLATPDQFIYHLKKLNMFSKVNAFNTLDMIKIDINADGVLDDVNINEMYLYLIPRITDYFSSTVNYFNVPFDAFYLDQNEKDRVINYIKKQGIVSISSTIKIIDPSIKKYIVNIFIRRYDDTSEENIREQVLDTLSSYFASYSRYDRIVKANLITSLKDIDGIDSVNLEFVGKDNEDYQRDGALLSSTQSNILQSTYVANSSSVNVSTEQYKTITTNTNNANSINNDISTNNTSPNYSSSIVGITPSNSISNSTVISYTNSSKFDPKKSLGIDPILGDIIIGTNELIVLRGGWSDRNGIYFGEDPTLTKGFSTVNIIWKGVTYRS